MYLGSVTGAMKSFLERLLYPYLTYTHSPGPRFPRKIRAGFIYTFNAEEENIKKRGYDRYFEANAKLLERFFGPSEALCSCDTYQFEDYSKYVTTLFDPLKKAKQRAEVFPKDCEKALAMGVRLIEPKS